MLVRRILFIPSRVRTDPRMPLSLLFALFLAFGLDTPARPAAVAMTWSDALTRTAEAAGGVVAVGIVAFVIGRVVAARVRRRGNASSRVRRAYSLSVRAVDILSVAVFAWILQELGWPRVVRSGFGLGDPVLIDDALILLPFLLVQVAGWWGLYAAERALRFSHGHQGLRRYLVLKGRQTLGMVLPVAALYGLGSDIVRRVWPGAITSPWEQPIGLALMGLVVLAGAPAFVRLAWPTRPLPPGPLRDRLENLARRVGFRCTDILVWDTNLLVLNAGVTGSLPWFRYVLLTDALIEHLGPHEVAAVFGHEIGHIAHRHLLYFGFFIVGSVGLIALGAGAFDNLDMVPAWATGDTATALVAQLVVALLFVGTYFLLVFGFVSRRFERQADVYGCRAVSCGMNECPPHPDVDGRPTQFTSGGDHPDALAASLCPIGIRIFINALTSVAMMNGIRPTAWSWRHGSILRRIAFLESLVGQPEAEHRFQVGVRRMRRGVAAVLFSAVAVVAVMTYLGR